MCEIGSRTLSLKSSALTMSHHISFIRKVVVLIGRKFVFMKNNYRLAKYYHPLMYGVYKIKMGIKLNAL